MDSGVPRLLDNIFNREFDEVNVGTINITLYTKDELSKAQKGYNANEKEDWRPEWIVIGSDVANEYIFYVDTLENHAIYVFINETNEKYKVSDSFENFLEVLKVLEEIIENAYSKVLSELDTDEEISREDTITDNVKMEIEIISDICKDCDTEFWENAIKKEIIYRLEQ